MSTPRKNPTPLVIWALRQKIVLDWWNSLAPWARMSIVEIYAKRMKWPMAEVNPEMTGKDDIRFLLREFPSSIEMYAREKMEEQRTGEE